MHQHHANTLAHGRTDVDDCASVIALFADSAVISAVAVLPQCLHKVICVHQQGQARSQSLCDASNASWQATVESRVDVGAPRHYARNLQRGSLVEALTVFELMKAVVRSRLSYCQQAQ
eukprot:19253-Heterococcus_DN1.PRE.4